MPDLHEVLNRSAPEVSTLDADVVRRRAVRRRIVPRALAVVCAVVVVGAGVVIVAGGDGASRRVESGSSPTSIAPSTSTSTTTAPPTTTVPSTTTPPSPTLPIGEDRLSTDSRLGYAGLGPIKLGMDFDAAVAAARVTVQPDPTCEITLHGEPGSGVESISVWAAAVVDTITVDQPGILTISGIAVGSTRAEVLATYPAATADEVGGGLVITNPEGHAIVFTFEADTVNSMGLFADLAVRENHARC
jgi:hypothetical protein